MWTPHHAWAGKAIFDLAVDLRGFYLKTGQFMGARGDFIPEPLATELIPLQDKVPPMSPKKVRGSGQWS